MSLADELELLADSVEAAQLLAESIAAQPSGHRAPRLLASMLALVEARLRLTRKAIVGGAASGLLAARHNERSGIEPGEDPDVLLPVSAAKARKPGPR